MSAHKRQIIKTLKQIADDDGTIPLKGLQERLERFKLADMAMPGCQKCNGKGYIGSQVTDPEGSKTLDKMNHWLREEDPTDPHYKLKRIPIICKCVYRFAKQAYYIAEDYNEQLLKGK